MKFSIEKQTLAGFGLALVVLVTINALSYWSFSKHRETDYWVTHTYEVRQKLESTLTNLRKVEVEQRGYLITEEEGFLKTYSDDVTSINQQIQEIQTLTADSPNQQRRIGTLKPLVAQRLAILSRITQLRREKGFEAARDAVRTMQGPLIMARIQRLIFEMEDEEAILLKQRLIEQEAASRTQNFVFSIGIVFNAVVFYWLYRAITREIQRRKRMQAALQKANEALEITVTELTTANEIRKQAEEELCQTLLKERELSELKSRIISIISHEYRTPLTTIQSSAELLEYYGHKLTEDKKLTHFQRIKTSIKHLTNLVSEVLLIGQAEANRVEFNPEPLDLQQFCRELVEEMPPSKNNQIPITFSSRGNCTEAYVDEKLLRQILTNLLSNAIKYSPRGGTVRFELECVEGVATLSIKDSGIGIPAKDLPLLFESFHRASNVGTLPGTGLGLAIVKKSVDLHGGQITVNSIEGVGTTLTVTLPSSGKKSKVSAF
jgi:signal transduction histidine kinase